MKHQARNVGARNRKKGNAATGKTPAAVDPLTVPSARGSFPIVGVGASAGGLEAFTQLLKHLPIDTGLGFVLVQHLDPQHESALTRILTGATRMPVCEVTNNLPVEANHVYIIPPNTSMTMARGILKLQPRLKSTAPHRSIDSFFESLAEDQRERAVGVILSGTATDGTLGLEAIKAEGGITFAQDNSAKYDSMPRSAVTAGCVDFVLSPEEIAKELARVAKHPYVAGQFRAGMIPEEDRVDATAHEDDETSLPSGGRGSPPTGAKAARREADQAGKAAEVSPSPLRGERGASDGFKKILLLLRNHSGVDFSLYKSTTIQRRITRRMVLNKQTTIEGYARSLRGNAKELDALYSDALISVTSFFRNPEAFDVLKHKVFPRLLQRRGDDPVRVWVLGCSTGQEAYSMAMTFAEASENVTRARKLQVFATDLNEALLDKARQGLYARSLAQDISPERLRRFFVEEQGGYRIVKPLREMVVFARQNLISDPPFSRMDLISCRNLLIYLEPSLQKKAFPNFHYALKPEGFLFLGASESIGGFTDLFEPADRKHKIYSKKSSPTPAFHLPAREGEASHVAPRAPRPVSKDAAPRPALGEGAIELSAQREADRVTVNQFAPPGVLINAEWQILQFRGPTSAYLEPPTGRASFDVLKMARAGLMLPLRAAVNKAKKENNPVRRDNIRIEQDGKARVINVQVIPLINLRERCFLILFEAAEKKVFQKGTKETKKPGKDASSSLSSLSSVRSSSRIAQLQRELSETRDYLQSIQEQHEAANEELQASNEEVQSANEELQSVNEELETSKEELESSNEELTTVNEEMGHRNLELGRLNSDLLNLQTSTRLAIVLLGRDLTIHRFSGQAEKQFNLLATDIGRPFTAIRHDLAVPDLEEELGEVITTLRESEQEVQDHEGRWFLLRMRPYMTLDNKVDGVVLVLLDITQLKRIEEEVRRARDYAEATIRTARDPLVVLRADLRVDSANEAFYKTFQVTPEETENVLIYELDGGQWNIPKLRELLEGIIPHNSIFNDFEVAHDFDHIGPRTMLLNARRLDTSSGAPEKILLGIEDITERLESQAALRLSEMRYRRLFEAAHDGVLILDCVSRKITDANPYIEELLGYTHEELLGKELWQIGLLKDQEESEACFHQLQEERSIRYEDLPLQAKSGEEREVEVVANIYDENGRQVIQCNIRDITERKLAEEGIKKVNDELAEELAGTLELQETSTLLIHGGDVDALYQQILGAGIAIMQSDMASLQTLDQERGELRLLAWRGFHPRSAAFWECVRMDSGSSCAVALRGAERIIVPDIESSEFMAGTPDLEEYRRSGIRAVQSSPLISRSGRLIGMISTHWRKPHQPAERALRLMDVLARQAADLLERVQTEGARSKLASIVESSEDAIISKDLNGIITSWNKGAQQLFGYTTQEAIGQSVTMLIPPDLLDEEPSIIERIRRGEAVEHYETIRRRKDGKLLNISLTVSPIRNSAGQVVGASKIARDITDRKEAEKALRESEALLADRALQLEQLVAERTIRLQDTISELEHFSYSITHDMRAPLRSMQGFGDMLLSESGNRLTSTSADYLRRIINAAGRMDALIRDSLQYAKVVRERIPLAAVEPDTVLRGILESYPSFQSPNVEIQIVAPLPPVIANETGLTQCFSNLLANAIKFVKAGVKPRIRIWAEKRDDRVRLWFEDNGIGIREEYQERIFSMFQQLDKSFEGTGIGLALVRKTAQRMDGKVGVESEPGEGSRFWLEFKQASPPTQ